MWGDGTFQCRVVLLHVVWIMVGQGHTVLAVGAGGGSSDIFSVACHFSSLGWMDALILRPF